MKPEPIGIDTEPTLEVDNGEKQEEILESSHGNVVDHGLHRGLKGRHLQMISLGGVVGYINILCMSISVLDASLTQKQMVEQASGTELEMRCRIQGRYVYSSHGRNTSSLFISGVDWCHYLLHCHRDRCFLRNAGFGRNGHFVSHTWGVHGIGRSVC
jgi:hypothetical protein